MSRDTQLNCRALFTIAAAFLSSPFFGFPFDGSSTFQCGSKHSALNLHPNFVGKNLTSGGCQHSQRVLVQVPFMKCLYVCRLNFPDYLLPLTFFLDALLPRVFEAGGSECGGVFGAVTVMLETTLVSLRTLSFFFSIDNKYLFSFQHHLIPCDS